MYGLYVPSDESTEELNQALEKLDSSFGSSLGQTPEARHLIGVTLQVAKLALGKVPGTKKLPQHQWLFELAGRIKGALPRSDRDQADLSTRLAPLALLYVDALESLGAFKDLKTSRLAWDDKDAVQLEFEEIWTKRKFAKGSPYLEEAAEFALNTPLPLTGNIHFIRVLSVAYYLQTKQPDLPILLPISAKLAGLLHTTPVTLGTAVTKAIREGYLEVADGHFDLKAGKARSFKFNFEHPIVKLTLP